jgi:hypothetical protein
MTTPRDRMKRAFGGWAATSAPTKDRDRFELLSAEATEAGVQWQDLTQDGYQAPGDMRAGGIQVHYDWKWRADEVQRRLDLADRAQ